MALAAVGAVLAGIGVGIADVLKSGAENTTHNLLDGSAGAPLAVRVAAPGTFFSGSVIGSYYVLPGRRLPSQVELSAAIGDSTELLNPSWAVAHGGVAGSPQVVRLQVRGNSETPVIISGIVPIVVARSAPIRGWYAASPGCGAEQVRAAAVNLDRSGAPVAYLDPTGTERKVLALRVTQTDPELIEIWASTRTAMVRWKARLFYSANGADGSVTIDDHGRPFTVTSETASDGYERAPGNGPGGLALRRQHEWDRVGIQAC